MREVGDLDESGVDLLLRRLADPSRDVEAASLLRLWHALGSLTTYPADAPARVRVLAGDGTRVVDADDAVVADAPMWLQRTDLGGYVVAAGPVAEGLADLLDLPLAREVATGRVDREGTPAAVPEVARWCPTYPQRGGSTRS